MDEPSLLDYLKSRLRFWKHDSFIPFPGGQEQASTPPVLEETGIEQVQEILPEASHEEDLGALQKASLPWRSLLGLLFILVAQRSFEPSPSRNAVTGLVLYSHRSDLGGPGKPERRMESTRRIGREC